MNRIKIIGCGPGAKSYVTHEAVRACAECDVLIGASRLFGLFDIEGVEKVDAGANVKKMIEEIAARCETRRVGVLVTGDPGVFSLAAAVIERFGRGRCDVVPGISSVQVALSRLGLGLAGTAIISAHHEKPPVDLDAPGAPDVAAVLAGSERSCGWIAEMHPRGGEGRAVFACEELTLEGESVRRVTLDELRKGKFSSRTVIISAKEELLK